MYRIYAALLELLAAAVFLIPLFCVYGYCTKTPLKRTLLYFVFGCYLTAVLALVGFPSVTSLRIDATINLIPFVDMVSDAENACLNVLLFVPLGLFLPLLWEPYRQLRYTAAFALATSAVIELAQLFTFRATDVNDLITNTVGALIGYALLRTATGNFTRHVKSEGKHRDVYLICGAVVVVMFFLQPFVSSFLWELVL